MTGSDDLVTAYERDGYVVIDSGCDPDLLDGTIAELKDFREGSPTRRFMNGFWFGDRGRLQDDWLPSECARQLATLPRILTTLEELYQARPIPFQTLNFRKGTAQRAHADSIHFNTEPFGRLCESRLVPARKGQAIIWQANLLHGGSRIGRPGSSRHSQVTHYLFEGSRFWRPMFSNGGRRYSVPPPVSSRQW